jgi:hypothetical protein
MESVVFFEKKLALTPTDFNLLKATKLDEILLKKGKQLLEGKCSEHGYVVPGSIKMVSRSMGYFESARFTGDAIYYVKLEGRVIYPVDGHELVGEVIRKNKMGLYVNYKDAIHIQVPRDLHLDNEEYDNIEVGEFIRVVIKRSKFAVYDPYILASGLFLELANEEDQNEEEEDNDDEYNYSDSNTNVDSNTNNSSLEEYREEEESEEEEEEEEEESEEKEN